MSDLAVDPAERENEDDTFIEYFVAMAEGWVELPVELPEDVHHWARSVLSAETPESSHESLQSGVAHLVTAARVLQAIALPGTVLALACQPHPDGPVLAMWTLSMAPIEYFPGPLDEEVKHFIRKGVPAFPEERGAIALDCGPAIRVRNACFLGKKKWPLFRRERIVEGVTYLVDLPGTEMRAVVDAWWEEMALGDTLAERVDLMARSLKIEVTDAE